MTTVAVYSDRFYDRLADDYDGTQAEVVVSRLRNALTGWNPDHFIDKELTGHDHLEQIRAGDHRIVVSRQSVRDYDVWYVLDVQPRKWDHRRLALLDDNAAEVKRALHEFDEEEFDEFLDHARTDVDGIL